MKEFLMNTDLTTVFSQHDGRNSRKCHDKERQNKIGDLFFFLIKVLCEMAYLQQLEIFQGIST